MWAGFSKTPKKAAAGVAESSSSLTSLSSKTTTQADLKEMVVGHPVSASGQCIFLFFNSNCQGSKNFIRFPM